MARGLARARVSGTLIAIILIAVTLSRLSIFTAQVDIDGEVSRVLRDLEYLSSRGVDVRGLVERLNEALELYQRGDVGGALSAIKEVEARASTLKGTAEAVYMASTAYRYGVAAALLSTPALVYLLLPRIYLLLWYRSRRRWSVRRVGK